MNYKRSTFDNQKGQSLLGRAAYNSLSPVKRRQTERLSSFDSPPNVKYNYLSEVSNRNQSVLKEMFSLDQRYAKHRQVVSHSLPNTKVNELPNFGFSSKNLRRKSDVPVGRRQLLPEEADKPQNYIKSQIRNSSFDPILGCDRQFETPMGTFRPLGTNGGDLYARNGLYRHQAPSRFQSSLRS